MAITKEKLAERLKRERNRLELTQEEVAERLGVKRPTIAQIEAANRDVSSIELSQLARIYKRDIAYFLSASEEALGIMHLRANGELDAVVRETLEKCITVCREATSLESLLRRHRHGFPFSYTLDRPRSRWEAVEQGRRVAVMERRRLDLGGLPVRNIVEIIAQHGVRVARYTLTDDIGGIFFVGADTGAVILVNAGHSATRRLFSYAHEYAHLLLDSAQTPHGVSRFSNRDDVLEVRANAFAAHFLMPEEGARAFLDGIGGPTRQVMEIYDGNQEQPQSRDEDLLTAQRRAAPGSQEVRMIDAVHLARHFGTSYEATVYHLLNLKMIQRETQEKLFKNKEQAEQLNTLLGPSPYPYLEQETMADLKQAMVNLTVEALLQGQISYPKACENMRLIDVAPQRLESLKTKH